MDLIEILFILLFVLVPLLEGMLRKGKKGKGKLPEAKPAPRSDRSGQRPPPRPMEEAPPAALERAPEPVPEMRGGGGAWWEQPEESAGRGSVDVSVPDDLWEVLTGERPEAEPEEWEEEAGTLERVEEEARRGSWEEGLERRPTVHEPPEVVSLETPPPPAEARHKQFHTKLDSTVPVLRRRGKGRAAVGLGLLTPKAARQAIVLREVLGPPRGLEEWGGEGSP